MRRPAANSTRTRYNSLSNILAMNVASARPRTSPSGSASTGEERQLSKQDAGDIGPAEAKDAHARDSRDRSDNETRAEL